MANEIVHAKGGIIVRDVGDKHERTLVAGALRLFPKTKGINELWICDIIINPRKKYKLPPSLAGAIVEDVLTAEIDTSKLEEVKEL